MIIKSSRNSADQYQLEMILLETKQQESFKEMKYHACVFTGVVLDEVAVQISQLLSADVSGWVIGGLEVQVVLPVAEELGGCHVHADDDLVGVAGLLDGGLQQLQSCRESDASVGNLCRRSVKMDRSDLRK